jgi:hypothetical protein
MTDLHLEPLRASHLDTQIVRLGRARLIRTSSGLHLHVEASVELAIRVMACIGIRCTAISDLPPVPNTLRPSIAFDLSPIDRSAGAVDVVDVHAVPLAEATRALVRRRIRWVPISRMDRGRCRALLHEEDVWLAWRRTVWCAAPSLREIRRQARLRPVVFDRGAIEHNRERWTFASEGALTRWALA